MASIPINNLTNKTDINGQELLPFVRDGKTYRCSVSSLFFNNAVTEIVISNGAVTTLKLANNAVTTDKINNNAVTTDKINNNAVTTDKLAVGIAMPAGAVMPFAMNLAPTGWLEANGATVSRTTYAALFAAIGTVYGSGDGVNTFNLPDLRGYFVRGSGVNSDATASGVFGAKQDNAFKSHTHTFPIRTDSGGSGTYAEGTPISTTTGTITTNSTGDIETRPSNIAMLYCIKI